MKGLKLLSIALFSLTLSLSAQNESKEISRLNVEIKKAAAKGDYSKAALLTKQKTTLIEIDKAVKAGDYSKAAELKASMPVDNSTKIASLKKEQKAAAAKGDYAKAAELGKQIKSLESGGSASPQNSNAAKIASLKAEQKKAASTGDYAKAAQIGKQIKSLENGGSGTVSQSTSSYSSSSSSSSLKPEFMNQVYLESNGRLSKLEKQTGELKTSTMAVPFYASSTTFYYVGGSRSNVQVNDNAVFKLETTPGLDPSEQFKLVKFMLDKKRTNRMMPYMKYTGSVYSGGSEKVDKHVIPITFKKVNGGIYSITPKYLLEPGEYAFMYINKFYCFSVN